MSTQVMALKLVELSEGRDCTSIYAYNGTFNKGVMKINKIKIYRVYLRWSGLVEGMS